MKASAETLVLFGATGDLAQRMLLPSLCALDADGLLHDQLRIVCTARSDMDDSAFRDLAREAIGTFLPEQRRGDVDAFLNRLTYQALDATQPEGYHALAEKVGGGDVAIFLSTAPSLFEATIKGLADCGLNGNGARIGLEKPLGYDLASSRHINDAVAAAFPEERVFRIDHYLGKETVQNLIALRFGNIMFEPLWNAQHIEHVQITVGETVGLESRAEFYDGTGALRPIASGESVTGQYRGGASGGKIVPGYDEELSKPSDTETFVAIKAHVDNWRWKGVPFYLRTGKRMPERVTEIVIQFRPVPHSIFAGARLKANRLVIGIQPEEDVTLTLMAKVPGLGEGMALREIPLDISMPDALSGRERRMAYERLLLDLIGGNQTLFVRRDEVEAQWAWIDRIRARWQEEGLTPRTYSAGSWGPSAAIALAERDGVSWHE